MNATGIICELNPPHDGHKRLFDFARNSANENTIVALMSGNFVQRGEPAIFSKHARAAAALRAGVDLVLELPSPYALRSADGFARSAVEILVATGAVKTLAFGSECGDLRLLQNAAEALDKPECAERIRSELSLGASYAAACQRALEKTLGGDADVLRSPNNTLGIQYLRAIKRSGADIKAVSILRENGITASGLREELRKCDALPVGILPEGEISYGEPVFPKSLELATLSRIRALPESAFFKAAGATDGIAERTIRCRNAGSLSELAFGIKSKRYAMSRIRRYLMCLTLGITDDLPDSPPYIRILGTNERGRALLKEMKPSLPVITKPADVKKLGGEAEKLLRLEAAATDFYVLGYSSPVRRIGGSEWTISPIIE